MSDLISREEVLRRARPEYLNPQQEKLSSYNQGWNNALDEYFDRIKALPSAERKTGRWVGIKEYCDHLNEEAAKKGKSTRYMPSGMHIGVYCDQCWKVNEKSVAYCPNCGADMRGEQDDNK